MADQNPFGIELIEDEFQEIQDLTDSDFAEVEEKTTPVKEEEKPSIINKKTTKEKEVETEPEEDPDLIQVDLEDKKPEEGKDKGKEKEDDGVSDFSVYSEALYDMGIFKPYTNEEGEEEKILASNEEEFKSMWKDQFQEAVFSFADQVLNSRGPEVRAIFDALYNDGVDPREYLPVAKNLQNFSDIDLEGDDALANAELVVREHLRRSGLSEDKINSRVERTKNAAQLIEEAEDVLPIIKSQDEKRLLEMQQQAKLKEQREKEQDANYRSSLVQNLQEKIKTKDFDGIPVNETTAKKAYDFLYTKKWKLSDGTTLTDFEKFYRDLGKPENISLRLKTGFLWMNGIDLSKIQKKAISTETNELFSKLKGKEIKQKIKKPIEDDWD